MPVIKVKDNESFEQAMKRFKKTCEKAGILTELRRRETDPLKREEFQLLIIKAKEDLNQALRSRPITGE